MLGDHQWELEKLTRLQMVMSEITLVTYSSHCLLITYFVAAGRLFLADYHAMMTVLLIREYLR